MLKKLMMLVVVLLLAVAAFAQDAPPLPVGETELEKLVIALFATVLPFVTGWLRKAMPSMPRLLVWSIPPVLGLAIGWTASYFGAGDVNAWRGLAGGLIAIALHEFRTTVQKHGVNG